MKKLYKYYSSTFNLEKYLNSPTIRLSQLNALNDPFEGFITQGVLNELANKFHTALSSNKDLNSNCLFAKAVLILSLILPIILDIILIRELFVFNKSSPFKL